MVRYGTIPSVSQLISFSRCEWLHQRSYPNCRYGTACDVTLSVPLNYYSAICFRVLTPFPVRAAPPADIPRSPVPCGTLRYVKVEPTVVLLCLTLTFTRPVSCVGGVPDGALPGCRYGTVRNATLSLISGLVRYGTASSVRYVSQRQVKSAYILFSVVGGAPTELPWSPVRYGI